ncbi:NADPH oxidase organizer 1-like [Mastacembelus armatus]|uniref:NADPH oxidase organizer 1b n=1 Tax=Mastacembelus armatus TaxID=205130 RepID=A0A3Q3L6Z4_9TELE|nr:NADPH oxidase organizer 1-like [Mastacembelus armatus]
MAGDQRFVLSARIIGAVHRDTPKLKVFMISVLWSDGAELVIYRSFQDFKKFHRQLKKSFPHLNHFRKNDRVIPKFRGKARRSSLKQKGSKRSVQRMKFLESYCDKLLKCDESVTCSPEVTRFFSPKDHDLQSDFTKNSIMIMLSDDMADGSGGDVTQQYAGSITHPFLTQTYRCVANYETKDTKNRPFKVAIDEKLDVLIKDPAGWWLVEKEDKRLAWFPAPYLESWEGQDGDDDDRFQMAGVLYCAVKSYSTKKDDEVSVTIGSVVEVLRKSDDGWWFVRFNGRAGFIPSMYLQPYNNPRVGLFSMQKKLHSSSLNLATSREHQDSCPTSVSEETNPERDPAGQCRDETTVSRRLPKARSLDVLSETWSQMEKEASTSDGNTRRMSNTSNKSRFSDFSSSSESSTSLEEEQQSQSHPACHAASHLPDNKDSSADLRFSDRRGSNTSSGSSGSDSSKHSETGSVTPRVPPRPKTEEILTRCTTMTRKAALATKTRLQIQKESRHSR